MILLVMNAGAFISKDLHLYMKKRKTEKIDSDWQSIYYIHTYIIIYGYGYQRPGGREKIPQINVRRFSSFSARNCGTWSSTIVSRLKSLFSSLGTMGSNKNVKR